MKVLSRWDPENLEIRSKLVEAQILPLIQNITTLLDPELRKKNGSKQKKGRSKKGKVLVYMVEKAVVNFVQKGEEIAQENPEAQSAMLEVIHKIRESGEIMSATSHAFVDDPCNSQKRKEMVQAARILLANVVRLLILADLLDLQLLFDAIEAMGESLEKLKLTPHEQLMEELKEYHKKYANLQKEAFRRQQNMNDSKNRDNLASARALLKRSNTMLMAASKAYVTHPDVVAARITKDQVIKQICEAVETINKAAWTDVQTEEEFENVATNLDSFGQSFEYKDRLKVQRQLDELVKSALHISENLDNTNERKESILAGCNAVKTALQNLISQSLQPNHDDALNEVTKKSQGLKRQLKKAIADEVSDTFLNSEPFAELLKAAENGQCDTVEICAETFTEHCQKILDVAYQVCELSNNPDGVKMVRYAASQFEFLYPEVINAARILAQKPQSLVGKENMETFKNAYEAQLQLLLDAVDDITTIDDILSVLDGHILEDYHECLTALKERNPEKLAQISEDMKKRLERIHDVVSAEMDNYEPCLYTKTVLQALKILQEEIVEKFETKIEEVVSLIENGEEIDENEFIDATRLVYEGVRDVRRAVLMSRADVDLDPEEIEIEETVTTITKTTEVVTEETEDMSGITVARQAMSQLPEKQKQKILDQVQDFHSEKLSFDKEVAKWEESSNDIVVLAKHMGLIMMEMTDFVRQRGPLKSTTEVIFAAKKISESGIKLDRLGREIAEQCPESSTKTDLLAYLERVVMYSHQINMIAKVKADIENTSNEELIIAGVESATSLIENAKNLMNAVVLTVKASYIASTKYSRKTEKARIVWKMKTPDKKPLVRLDRPQEVKVIMRKASQRKPQNPLKILSEFQ